MRSEAATRPATAADPHPAAYGLLAGLVDDALALSEDLRAHSADPILHATVEALTATRGLLRLAADATVPAPPPDGPATAPASVENGGARARMTRAGSDAFAQHPPERRDAALRNALDSIRAASTAIRFALVEEGDRQRSRRSHTEGHR